MGLQQDIQVSVIIPAFNEEKLIGQLLGQFTPKLKNKHKIEVIVSDGGSTDGTMEIARQYSDKVICPTEGRRDNIAKGRNKGAEAASGEFFYIMNADTLMDDPDKFFLKTLDHFNKTSATALTCAVKVFPDSEKISDKLFHFIYNHYVKVLNRIGMGMGRGECHMIRREAFEDSGGYNENMAAGEDFDLYRRISKRGKIIFVNGITIYESPRRYRKYGYISVLWDWTKNSVSVVLKNKAISKEWEAVR